MPESEIKTCCICGKVILDNGVYAKDVNYYNFIVINDYVCSECDTEFKSGKLTLRLWKIFGRKFLGLKI